MDPIKTNTKEVKPLGTIITLHPLHYWSVTHCNQTRNSFTYFFIRVETFVSTLQIWRSRGEIIHIYMASNILLMARSWATSSFFFHSSQSIFLLSFNSPASLFSFLSRLLLAPPSSFVPLGQFSFSPSIHLHASLPFSSSVCTHLLLVKNRAPEFTGLFFLSPGTVGIVRNLASLEEGTAVAFSTQTVGKEKSITVLC